MNIKMAKSDHDPERMRYKMEGKVGDIRGRDEPAGGERGRKGNTTSLIEEKEQERDDKKQKATLNKTYDRRGTSYDLHG